MSAGGRALLVFAVLALAACTTAPAPKQPNILLILADDLGIEGLKAYGNGYYETPHLDAMAAGGVRFEHVFATPVCVPSRVELLTGQYPFRNGWSRLGGSEAQFQNTVSPKLPSIARALRNAGYATAVAGKWHLAPLPRRPAHPQNLGFQTYSLWTQAAPRDRYWAPNITENGVVRKDLMRDDVYGPDVATDFLIDFIERNKDRPWFAFYPTELVHRPYTATPATVKSGKESIATRGRRGYLTNNQENVAYMDALVGRLLSAIQRLGLEDRTFIFFTADNGTDAFTQVMRDGKIVPGGKTHLDEAGAEVPLLVTGPGVVEGAVLPGPIDLTDFFPTLLELTGVPRPKAFLDGKSFASQLRGEDAARREWAYVQQSEKWFVSDSHYRLHGDGRFFDVSDRLAKPPTPLHEPLAPAAAAARAQLETAARQLRPELGPIPAAVPTPTASNR